MSLAIQGYSSQIQSFVDQLMQQQNFELSSMFQQSLKRREEQTRMALEYQENEQKIQSEMSIRSQEIRDIAALKKKFSENIITA